MRQFGFVLRGLPLLSMAYSQSLPYNPTTILLPSDSSDSNGIAYVFLPNAISNTYQLAALNISTTISQSNLSIETITSSLPFVSGNSTAFVPSISSAGEITVYAGSCWTPSGAVLWRFTPINTTGDGTWTKGTTTFASDGTSDDLPGADFLSRGFSFSTLVHANASETNIYVFGGMCPTSSATASTWQSAASYSNHMLKLSPSSSTAYSLDLTDSTGPPIAEAGFTITGLPPTYSNGSGVMIQGQNFVLLGGHTQTAFINMSQVAVWSLPEESWSFQTVASPSSSSTPNTELAIKSTLTSVDSRSGHTAVLAEDGSKIIVLGGWVGDIGQAADPQLAVLNVESGFGGTGEWAWSIPDEQPAGTGFYGHGAVMLPGNVMMVLGGYNISSSTSTKRETSPETQILFLNTTSMSWISNYTNPAYAVATAKSAGSSSKSSKAKEIGLGAGLGIGLAAIFGAMTAYFWYSRRLRRKRRAEREKIISSLSLGAADYYSPTREMNQTGGGFPWSNGGWNRSSGDQVGPGHDSNSTVAGYENLNAGLLGFGDHDIPPPPPRQILRKPLKSRNTRGLYQPAPNYEFGNIAPHGRSNSLGTAGPIHPIYEADEDDHVLPSIDTGVGGAVGEPLTGPGSSNVNRYSDPFKDPPAITYSTSLRQDTRSIMTNETESPAQSREREIQEWVSDWAAADAMLSHKSHSQAGRLSPSRRAQLITASNVSSVSGEEDSGRTASNLSERSLAVSAVSLSRSGSSSQGRSRSNSLRGFISSAVNPFTSTILSTTVASTSVIPVFDGPGRSKYNNKPPGSSGSGSSFTTAHTSFPALQAEGEGLLPRPDEFAASGENSPTRSQAAADSPGSPSKSKAPMPGKARQMGWLGSLRRGFFGGGESGGSGNNSPDSQLLSSSSREPSPVRVGGSGVVSPPRRTVSAGATLWRRKQGRGDWEDSADFNPGNAMPRSNTFTGEPAVAVGVGVGVGLGSRPGSGPAGGDEDEEEWDIERAVQNRVVQVMFTVPKEKLRVVNHSVEDDAGSDISSLRSKRGSNKSLRAVGSSSLGAVGEAGAVAPAATPLTPDGKGKGMSKGKSKVLEMVEKMEEKSRGDSPER